jgi:hypothetical protein
MSVDEFKAHFNAIEKEFDGFHGFDTAPKNCILPMFYSYDDNLLYKENPETFTDKIYKVNQVYQPPKQYVPVNKTPTVERIICKKIIPITGNGHPQLRAAAYLLGGYVGANHIDREIALSLLYTLIDQNAYLSQKAPVYKRTAQEMVDKGINCPVYLLPTGTN